MDRYRLTSFILRIGLAIVFFYAAVSSFLEPTRWIGFMPQFLRHLVDGNLLLNVFSVYELGLALWLISEKKTFYAALLAAATLAAIVITNITQLEIIFRDIAILFSALALAVLTHEKKESGASR